MAAHKRLPIGTVRIRTRHKRGGVKRAWVKVAEPNVWALRARVVWEQHNGPIPPGFGVHHKDENKLNDDPTNLELASKARHLDLHRAAYIERATASTALQRRERRWSTKSATKRTGRPPRVEPALVDRAAEAYKREGGSLRATALRFGVPLTSLARYVKAT